MPYEVQMYTSHQTWKNACVYDEGDGLCAETFATAEEAEAALDEYLQDLEEEFHAGTIGRYDRDDFRVRYVPNTTTDLNNQPTGERL